MTRISAVILTLNEEANIGDCIDSVKRVAEEVIIMDSGSTDNTKSICMKRGVRFVEEDWKGYSWNKNKGNELASNDHILSLDADERLDDRLVDSIKQVQDKLGKAYSFNRLNNFYGRFLKRGGFYPDKKIRLFDRRVARWVGDHVHEYLQVDEGIEVKHLKGDLIHYTYSDLNDHKERISKYTKLGADKFRGKSKSYLLFKRYFTPFWRFVNSYFIKLGILEGKEGFHACRMHALTAKLQYANALKAKRSQTTS